MFLVKFFRAGRFDGSVTIDVSTVAWAEAWACTYRMPWQTWTVEHAAAMQADHITTGTLRAYTESPNALHPKDWPARGSAQWLDARLFCSGRETSLERLCRDD